MGKEKHGIEFKAVMPLEQLKTYLKDLLDGLDKGALNIQSGDRSVTLTPTEMVKVEVEAKEKKDKSKFSLELSWYTEMETKGDPAALKISSAAQETQPNEPAKEPPDRADATPDEDISDDDEAEILRHGE